MKFSTGAALSGALSACGGSGSSSAPPPPPVVPVRPKVVVAWNDTILQAIRAVGPGAPIAARSLAVINTAMYDAWSAYDPVALATCHGGLLRRPAIEHTAANKTRAISYAAYAAMRDQFPTQLALIDARMAALGFNPLDPVQDTSTPHGLGTLAAASVLEHAHQDGANQLGTLTPSGVPYADYSGYVPLNPPMIVNQPTPRSGIPYPDRWQPLSYLDAGGTPRTPAFAAAYWGQVRPFALSSGQQFRPGPPAAFGTQAFIDQAQQIVELQAALTEQHKAIIEYWAGGLTSELPSGYWSQFAQFISARDQHDDDADIKMFFALANANFDAGIAAWDAKRAYDSARPVTAIRYLMNGTTIQGYGFDGPAGSLRAIAGEAWVPYQLTSFPTPPFADHVSGHSTYSAASAEVLKLFTGSDTFRHGVTIAARSSRYDPRLPTQDIRLSWETFTDAANEAGQSRLYGGIHFARADVDGRALGAQVGAAVFDRARRYWSGTA